MRTRLASARKAWDEYWFAEGSLAHLGLTRVVLVGFQLAWFLASGFGGRLAQHAELWSADSEPLWVLRLVALPLGGVGALDGDLMHALYSFGWVCGLVACAGLATRVSLALFAWSNVLLLSWIYSVGRLHHPEALLSIALVALACAPAGRAWSLDARLRGRRGGRAPTHSADALWPLLLVRWLVALAYLSAVGAKLAEGGVSWANGYTLQYFTFIKGMALERPLGLWISEHHRVAQALSLLVLAFEGTFWVVLRWPRLARVYVPLGIALHVGMYVSMGPPFFQFLALYVVFLPAAIARPSGGSA